MAMRRLTVLAIMLALTGCFKTDTRLVIDGSYAGTLRDGRYHAVCLEADGQGLTEADAVMMISAAPLPDGRTGVQLTGEDTLLAEVAVLTSNPTVTLASFPQSSGRAFEHYLVLTAPGIDNAFLALLPNDKVEEQTDALDAAGDRAGILAALKAAIAAKDYSVTAAYAVSDLIAPDDKGRTAMPAELSKLAVAAGHPLPACR